MEEVGQLGNNVVDLLLEIVNHKVLKTSKIITIIFWNEKTKLYVYCFVTFQLFSN